MELFLYQSPQGYCYNSDSIFLYAFAREYNIKGDVLDIGCGVGVLSLLLAKRFRANFYAVEKQEKMFFYAQKNAKVNNCALKITNCDFSNFAPNTLFDYIVSNPPFYSVDKNQTQNVSKSIARYSYHLPLEQLITKSAKLLKPKGYFIFCYDAWQVDTVLSSLKRNKMQPEAVRFMHSKANKEAKIVMIAARKDSKAKCKVLPPFITFCSDGSYTKEAREAFSNANTHSIKALYD